MNTSPFQYRVAVLGAPSCPDVPWTEENLQKLKDLGFNAIQLNIAWGGRPMDEALNLEDVVELTPQRLAELKQPDLPPRSVPERRAERQQQLHERMALAKQLGFRTIFHFGAPFNAQYSGLDFEGPQAHSLLDPETTVYYEELLSVFAEEYREVDDILVYTFDQDAWLTSEFGSCSRTRGIPLHERVVPFLEALAKTWRSFHPDGLLWWSPWELSGGQLFQCLENIVPDGIGVDLHSAVGEVITSMPVDRWFKNTVNLANQRGMPVMCESFLGAVCEETEPFQNLAYPPLTIRQVKSIAAVPGVAALKEYYGLLPVKEDPNLEAAALAMMNPSLSEEEILQQLSGGNAALMEFWNLTAQALEFFPWDLSWWIRCVGMIDVSHSLSAATLRGESCATPSWCSTRAATFMKTDAAEPHPWMLEDVQLRCSRAVHLLEQALAAGQGAVPPNTLRDTAMLKEKILSYVCHLRETNLANVMRDFQAEDVEIPKRVISEMEAVLEMDQKNQQAAMARIELPLVGADWIWVAGQGSEDWNPFAPCEFRFTFQVRVGVRDALLSCASSESLVRVRVSGTELESFGAGIQPFGTRIDEHLSVGENTIEMTVPRAGSLYNREALCARVAVSYDDGTKEVFGSGPDWQAKAYAQAEWSVTEVVDRFTLEDYRHEYRPEKMPSLFRNARQGDGGVEVGKALALFRQGLPQFLNTFFQPVEDARSRGHFSVTSC